MVIDKSVFLKKESTALLSLDEEEHTPMALMMLSEICGQDDDKWQEVQQTALQALQARITFWDGVVEQINLNRA